MSAPSTKSFDKTRRAIQKKKRGGKIDALHAFSRDSRRLTEASARDQRLDKLAANRARKEQPILERVRFFKQKINELRVSALTPEQIAVFISELVHEHDGALSELKKARRPGRPASTKEDLLKRKIEALSWEHDNGFFMPDLVSEENVARLDRWDGSSWPYLCTLVWVRVTKAGVAKPAVFPPSSGNH